MKQADRIADMERALDASAAAVSGLSQALEEYAAARAGLKALAEYYESPLWLRDCDDDAAGKISAEQKKGVLSQDAVYDLLAENDRVMEAILTLAREISR